jgi:DNA-binding PadR family transcriptional regulator
MRRKTDTLIPFEADLLNAAKALTLSGEYEFHGIRLAKVLSREQNSSMAATGKIYRALRRLEDRGCLTSHWESQSDADAGGRPRRRLYRLDAQAELALRDYNLAAIGRGRLTLGRASA